MAVEVGKIVEGRVDGITSFGAFIDIGEGKTGLVHISEVAVEYVKDIKDFLKEGQKVKVKIVGIEKNGKIALSIKKAVDMEKPSVRSAARPVDIDWNANAGKFESFEDKMQKFKHDSDERMQAIKRNMDSKRGYSRKGNNSY